MGDLLVARDVERTVLGAAIESPQRVLGRHHDLQPDAFYDGGHQALWRLLLKMSDDNTPISLVSVNSAIRSDPETYGGHAYVSSLADDVLTDDIGFYVAKMRDLAQRREVRARLADALDRVAEHDLGELIASIDPGSDPAGGRLEVAGDVAVSAWDRILEKRQAAADGNAPVLSTPWPMVTNRWNLDPRTGGLIIVAGRPGMGKTAAGIQICQAATRSMVPDRNGGHRPGAAVVYSLEMDAEDLLTRAAAQRSTVSTRRVSELDCPEADLDRFRGSLEELSGERLWIDSTPDRSADDIVRRLRRHVQRHGPVDYVMVDYAELMRMPKGGDLRYDQLLGEATKTLRNAAREMGFWCVLVWQLNRKCEARKPPIPRMSDIAESGQAERHADVILFCYRDDYYYPESSQEPGKIRLITAKLRKGEPGTDHLDWVGRCTSIVEIDQRHPDA